ncbi:NADH-quinone oxidoreductase subunit H [Candidatus Ozemobacteraceae bacterium]|nr:NADH-quinone oxidoreductase subunit H [Candidatus Ozemobacteraceae bacterium]
MMLSLLHPLLALIFAPLLQGVINKTKALFAGRRGPPLLQPYWDIAKLLRKGAVYSETTTRLFRLAPAAGVAIGAICLVFLPLGNLRAAFSFEGDLVFVIYLLALHRFLTVIAAMDTGSAFEGMGASREMTFSALAEPALLFGLVAVARQTGRLSLEGLIMPIDPNVWIAHGATFMLVLAGLFLVYLAENSRIPVDDPNTHLELTMIHEVMVLDHGGVDFAFIEYAAALKLWILGALITGIAVPVRTGVPAVDIGAMLAGMAALAVLVGVVESTLVRLRLVQVPHLLIGACAFSIVGIMIQ